MVFERARRAFFSGPTGIAKSPPRPPWALGEEIFLERCTRCADCVDACPEAIIGRGSGGFPEVFFSLGACTFCGACARACTAGALNGAARPWLLRARIGSECLATQGVACRVCGDWCAVGALRFALHSRSTPPVIDPERCTQCGGCVARCPVRAIRLEPAGAPAHG